MTRDKENPELSVRIPEILDDANNSRPGSREALRKLTGEHRSLAAMLAKDFGNMATNAEEALIRSAAGGNVLVDESARAWITEVQRALAEPGDTELDLMLVHRTALCWLAVNTAEQLRAQKWKGGISSEAAGFWDRHVSRLQDDLLRAARTLATVRKLRRPVLQMNIAERQINVAR
jgi:hypothetical protein